jgi:hypothetical protein
MKQKFVAFSDLVVFLIIAVLGEISGSSGDEYSEELLI